MSITKTDKKKGGLTGYRVRVSVVDSRGQRIQKEKTVYGLDAAKNEERKMLAELKAVPSNSITFLDVYHEYTQSRAGEIRETSLKKLNTNCRIHLIPFFGKMEMSKISVKDVQIWKNKIKEQGFTHQSNMNIYASIRAIFKYAEKMEYISKNPVTIVGNFTTSEIVSDEDKIRYYTPEQFKRFMDAAKEYAATASGHALYTFFAVAYFTGMRKGEINALKWSDIDGDMIRVRRSINQKQKGEKDVETPPKNKSSIRDIQAPEVLMNILLANRAIQEKHPNFSEDFRVCGGPGTLRDTTISNFNNMCAKEAMLPQIRVHDFRHCHASLLANEGINIQEIARRLGHSDIETTWKTYAHLYPRENERAIKVLEKIKL